MSVLENMYIIALIMFSLISLIVTVYFNDEIVTFTFNQDEINHRAGFDRQNDARLESMLPIDCQRLASARSLLWIAAWFAQISCVGGRTISTKLIAKIYRHYPTRIHRPSRNRIILNQQTVRTRILAMGSAWTRWRVWFKKNHLS